MWARGGGGEKGHGVIVDKQLAGKASRYATAFHFRRFSSGPASEGHRYASQYLTNLYAHSRAAVCTSHASEYVRGYEYKPGRECDSRTRPDVAGASMHICTHARYYIARTRIYSVANAIKPIDEITADRGPLSLSLFSGSVPVHRTLFSSARCLKRRKAGGGRQDRRVFVERMTISFFSIFTRNVKFINVCVEDRFSIDPLVEG